VAGGGGGCGGQERVLKLSAITNSACKNKLDQLSVTI
jgi:hypothetical protein